MLAMMGLAAGLLCLGVWAVRRAPSPLARPRSAASAAIVSALPVVDADPLSSANAATTQRLWRLAFAGPEQSQDGASLNQHIRDNVIAILQVDSLDSKYFPRRPTLMPQLMQAVNDPNAATERVARIIGHDPVLTAEVLRLANSSLYRRTSDPVETIQRALVVCGADSLRGMLATAMLRPVFRATRKNFPRFPRILWDRTERAARAAELYAMEHFPEERFEAQMTVLLSALGPLVVYSAALDVYTRNPHVLPSPSLCMELIGTLAPDMSRRLARDWQASPRMVTALTKSPAEPLCAALDFGELFGTLALLESQMVISVDERQTVLQDSGLPQAAARRIWTSLTGRT